MDIQGLLQQAIGSGNGDSVAQATSDHIATMDTSEVTQHLQTAADTASANGQPDVASEIQDLLTRAQSDPDSLKAAAIDYVKSNPQVLEHFAPTFAQGILSRL